MLNYQVITNAHTAILYVKFPIYACINDTNNSIVDKFKYYLAKQTVEPLTSKRLFKTLVLASA